MSDACGRRRIDNMQIVKRNLCMQSASTQNLVKNRINIVKQNRAIHDPIIVRVRFFRRLSVLAAISLV